METEREVFWCDCHNRAISVEKDAWDGEITICIQLWRNSNILDLTFTNRIRIAWAALCGRLYHDGVVLEKDEVKELITVLKASIKAPIKTAEKGSIKTSVIKKK